MIARNAVISRIFRLQKRATRLGKLRCCRRRDRRQARVHRTDTRFVKDGSTVSLYQRPPLTRGLSPKATGGENHHVFCGIITIRAGDEARFLGVQRTPRKEASPSRPAMPNMPLACWIKLFEPRFLSKKKKTSLLAGLFFLERATRLELATSTLARWRSIG